MTFQQLLFRRIDIAPLIYFRTVVGGLITIELIGEWLTGYKAPFLHEGFHFNYQLTPWLQPWPPFWMEVHFVLNILLAILVTIGLFYRFSALLLFLGLFSSFLMEQAAYINHTYMYSLLALLMVFMPANAVWSVDARRRPEIRQSSIPAWMIHLLRFQLALVYIFAGLAKLNPDWLAGIPMNLWLPKRASYPIIGDIFTLPWLPLFMSWAGAALDLCIVPALLWKRSRPYAFALICLFHLTNVVIFGIGTFPWLSIAMSALFFPPRVFRRLPILRNKLPATNLTAAPKEINRQLTTALLLGYAFLQLAIPLRQFAYPGNTSYTEDAHNFSWHMMLRDKKGLLSYRLYDPDTQKGWWVDPRSYLHPKQYRKAIGKPDMLLNFAHFLRDTYQEQGHPNVEVYAYCRVAFNGRPMQLFTDTTVNLAQEKRHLGSYHWVLPLQADE